MTQTAEDNVCRGQDKMRDEINNIIKTLLVGIRFVKTYGAGVVKIDAK